MIKAVFFDVDGTLVSFENHKVPVSTIESIKELQKKGIKVFVATGRDYGSLYIGNNVDEIDFDGFVTLNGQYAFSKEKEILHEKTMDKEDVENAINYVLDNDIACAFVSNDMFFVNKINDRVRAIYESVNLPMPQVMDPTKARDMKIFQVNPFVEEIEEEKFMKNMKSSISTRWSPLFVDVIPVGGGKHKSISKIIELYGFDKSEIMTFGDGGNDKSMIEFAGIGVAMGNANPEIKEIADYITDTVDNDGVLKALKHFNVL